VSVIQRDPESEATCGAIYNQLTLRKENKKKQNGKREEGRRYSGHDVTKPKLEKFRGNDRDVLDIKTWCMYAGHET
jgi:hypothetical protein